MSSDAASLKIVLLALILKSSIGEKPCSCQAPSSLQMDPDEGVKSDSAVADKRNHIGKRDAVPHLGDPAHQRRKDGAPNDGHHDQRAANLSIPIQAIDAKSKDGRTSMFPLGGPVGAPPIPKIKGWNLEDTELTPVAADAGPGVHSLTAGRKGFVSNRVPFAVDTLPEVMEQEPNNDQATAQKVTLPVIINGRIGKPDDWDVFEFTGSRH